MKTAAQLIAFEERIKSIFAAGELPFLIHLSGGNEQKLIELFANILPYDWVFSSHRSHWHYLLKGGSEEKLEQMIRDGRSMFVFDHELKFFTSSVLGGCCGIAAGVASEIKHAGGKEHVWCFLGDGAADNGALYEAALYVHGNDLPCTFIIEDNDRSVEATKADRFGRNFGNPLVSLPCVWAYSYSATYPHGGAGLPAGSVSFKPEVVERFAAR